MDEPPFACRRVYERALMGSVDLRFALGEDDLFFVRSVNILGSQHELPTGRDSARGSEDVIVPIQFVKLRALDSWMIGVAIEHHSAVVKQTRAVRFHPADD